MPPALEVATDIKPGHLWEHPIKNNGVGANLFCHENGFLAIASLMNDPALGLEIVGKQFPLSRLILHKKDFRGEDDDFAACVIQNPGPFSWPPAACHG